MFIKLNLDSDKQIVLNMDNVFTLIELRSGKTEIDFGNDFVIVVQETPEEILDLIEEAKSRNAEIQAQTFHDVFYSIMIQKL